MLHQRRARALARLLISARRASSPRWVSLLERARAGLVHSLGLPSSLSLRSLRTFALFQRLLFPYEILKWILRLRGVGGDFFE